MQIDHLAIWRCPDRTENNKAAPDYGVQTRIHCRGSSFNLWDDSLSRISLVESVLPKEEICETIQPEVE